MHRRPQLPRHLLGDPGQSLIEYALIVTAIAVVVIAAAVALGLNATGLFDHTAHHV